MTLRTLYAFIAAVVLTACQHLSAQTYNFRNFNEDNGLPQGYIYHLSQGRNGFLYTSTGEGLATYGGKNFKVKNKDNGLAENFITTHLVDSRGNTWAGHYQEGLSFCKSPGQSFIPVGGKELKNVRVNCIAEDRNGTIWVGTFGKGVFTTAPGEALKVQQKISPDNANAIYADADNHVLIASNEGVGVYRLNATSGLFELLEEIDSLSGFRTVSIQPSADSSLIWLAVCGKGIVSLKKSRGSYYLNSVIRGELAVNEYEFRSLSVDRKNNLWAATFGEGVRKIAMADNEGYSFTVYPYTRRNGLINDYVQSIYCDQEGNVWIGTYGSGLVQLVDEKFTFFRPGKEGAEVFAVAADKQGELWMGTPGGLLRFAKNSDGPELLFNGTNGFVTDKVSTLYLDQRGYLWIGTSNNGLYTLDTEKKKFTSVSSRHSLTKKHINHITGNNDKLFISTTEGLYIYDIPKDEFSEKGTRDGLLHNNIYHVYAGRAGKLWIACHGSTFFNYFNDKVTSFKDIPEMKSFNINSVTEDGSGRIWFVTEGDGVFCYDGGTFENYSVAEGLASNYCYSIICDKNNTIWVGHKNGISRKSDGFTKFTSFGKGQGILSPELSLNANYLDPAGNIWFGTSEGLIRYDKSKDRINSIEPSTHILGMNINGTYGTPAADTVMPYRSHSVKFDFVGISLTEPGEVRYRYILEGFETDWNEVDASVTSVSYPKLEDGKYTFKLLARNNDGVWNSTPVSYSFSISKPVWKQWWFFLLAFAVTAVAVFLIIRWRTNSLVRLSLRLERMVDEKTLLLKKEKENVEKINEVVEEQNRDITDSINYALKIQEAMLPSKKEILEKINAFIFYAPRDIVSGDFYWYSETKDSLIIAAVDCTGHGVPGAFMSLIGSTLLSKIVNDYGQTKPAEILKLLNRNVTESLHQNTGHYSSKDGMEMALCSFDLKRMKMVFAGAGRPLVFVRDGELVEYQGSIFSVGGAQDVDMVFYQEKEIDIRKGDMIYLFTDGYPDQFGGEKNRKFSTKRLKELLVGVSQMDISEQEWAMKVALEEWKGDTMQIDDILVMGIKI